MSTTASRLKSVRRCLLQGDTPGALKKIRHMLRGPLETPVALALGAALIDLGLPSEALEVLKRPLASAPSEPLPQVRVTLAKAHNLCGQPSEALLCLHPLIEPGTSDADAWYQVGWSFALLRDRPQALTALQEAVKHAPEHGDAWLRLGGVLTDEGHPAAAAQAYVSAAEAVPHSPLPFVRLAFLWFNLGRLDDAKEAFGRALEREAGHPPAIAGLALIRERQGDLDAAYDLCLPLVERKPTPPMIAVAFATICRRRGSPQEARLVVERALAQRMPAEERTLLLHARADLLDADARYDEAFAAYAEANAYRGLSFDGPQHVEAVRAMIGHFPEVRFASLPTSGSDDELPVLIVGMPRSGTSLVEQILASHPRITGAGELEDWRKLAIATSAEGRLPGIWYAHLDKLTPELLQTIAEGYLGRLHSLKEPGAVRVTDKMPANALHLGLVALACPKARVIYCERDPRDTGWSCFRQQFGDGLAWATDLASIGHYQRSVDLLMEHWSEVLPLPIHRVRYESLVEDLEEHARALCAFVGVDWDPACLSFHENRRLVPTASYAQVRRAIYGSSVGRHAPYAAHLGPLFDALGLPPPS